MLTLQTSQRRQAAQLPGAAMGKQPVPAACVAIFVYAIFLIFLECRLFQIRNTYKVVSHSLWSQRNHVEILILGTSHSQLAINPKILLLPAANVATYSQSLELDKQLACKIIPQLPNLKLVILPVSYFALDYRLCDSGESWRDYYYNYFWGVSERAPWERLIDPKYWFLTLMYGPNLCRQAFLTDHLLNLAEAESIGDDGWWSKEPSHATDCSDSYASHRAQFHLNLMHSKYRKGNVDNLLAIADACANKGIKIAFITTPTMQNYRSYFGKQHIAEVENVIQSIARSKGIVWKDFADDSRFGKECFLDCDHLNMQGAARFSSILNNEVIKGHFGRSNTASMDSRANLDRLAAWRRGSN
jgi:hypothetical protein